MKVSVTQENLSRGLHVVGRIAGGRTTLPILANILLTTEGNQLKLSATNLEVGIIEHLSAKIDKPGSITIPARLLHDYVSSLPPTNITLSTDEHKLHLEAERFNSVINGITAEEFPSIPEVKHSNPIVFEAGTLKSALQRCLFAASTDDTRPVLTAIYLYTHNATLYAVATDSYRLSEQVVLPSIKSKSDFSLLIPARSLQELVRVVPDEAAIELSWDEAQAELRFNDTTLITRLIEGTYPQYRELIPASGDIRFEVPRDELTAVTKVASLFARESAGGITLLVDEKSQTISIRSVASQIGENTSTAEATVTGSGEVTINSRYLIDALSAISSKTISFRFSGKVSPCVIEPVGEKGQLHVIMPLRS